LLELGWIKPRGRRRTPGRPLTWGTSPAFLDHFGLAEITDLPGLDDLKAAGLLRKGQILGAMMDHGTDDLDADTDESDEDLLEDSLLEAGFDGEDNAEL
jgi:segregation and condensation protein B